VADDHVAGARQAVAAPEIDQVGLVDQIGDVDNDDVGGDDGKELGSQLLEQTETQLRRALADLDNLRKRYEREVARERTDERTRVAREWLPVVDNLERALEHFVESEAPIVAGVRAVYEQALSVLAHLGFPRFDDAGEPFDPRRHEAVGTIDADAPAGTIVGVARPGYGGSGGILRPASVIVAKPR
jgi:molecular chaperone GrpE